MHFETARLRVRDPVLADVAGVHRFLSDPAVMRWTHLGPAPYTLEQSHAWVETQMLHNRAVPRFSHNAVILDRESGDILGWIGIGEPADTALGDLDFGYALRRDCWGRGYMAEALTGMLAFAFEQLGANSIFGECEAVNVGSCRVMEKAGMQRVQQFLEARQPGEPPVPMLRYRIVRAAWAARR